MPSGAQINEEAAAVWTAAPESGEVVFTQEGARSGLMQRPSLASYDSAELLSFDGSWIVLTVLLLVIATVITGIARENKEMFEP